MFVVWKDAEESIVKALVMFLLEKRHQESPGRVHAQTAAELGTPSASSGTKLGAEHSQEEKSRSLAASWPLRFVCPPWIPWLHCPHLLGGCCVHPEAADKLRL